MRPLELSLTGFRSYPSPVTVDFTGKSLAAALGDTGAGKSSLLDAITYALFRKSSWDARETRQLIADGAEAMNVTFTFLHDGHRWRVHRAMHATNPNAGRHHLRNLDTGQEEDGAGAVDTRIRTVLQMGYDTFLRVGLLPQGKFDQLLTAATKERTTRLRELFGADALETVRQLATRHRESLKDLLAEAKVKRGTMPDNPAQAAAAAGAAADAAEASTKRLDTAITSITTLQRQASSATAAAAAADRAAQSLAENAVPDATSILDTLAPVVADLAARRESLDGRAAAAAEQDRDLTTKIKDAEARGEGRDALVTAATIVDKLATLAEDHRGERDRLADLNAQLAADADAIAADEEELAQRAEQAEPLIVAAGVAADISKRLNAHGVTVRARVAAATAAAQQIARAAQARSTAVGNLDAANRAVPPLEEQTAAAEADLKAAQEQLDALQLRDRAAGVAAELHAGDDCPVCRRELPADFEPASGTNAAELRAAKTLLRETKTKRDTTAGKLAKARLAVTTAETATSERADEHRTAQQTTQRITEEAVRLLADFASLAAEAEEAFDTETTSATLTAATAALAAPSEDSAPDPEQLIEPMTVALAACERAAADRADRLRAKEIRHTIAIETERTAVHARKDTHQKAIKAAKAASARHTRAVTGTTAEICALPTGIQTFLPDNAIDVGADAATAAATAIAAALAEVQSLLDAREAARKEKNTVLIEQRSLDQETRVTVDEPLTTLRGRLDAWANAATQAVAHLFGNIRNRVPDAPTESGITDIRTFATALSTAAAALRSELTTASAAHSARADDAYARFNEQAAALADIDEFDPAADLTDPQLLHPLVAAHATASNEAEVQRRAQSTAQAQVQPSADLDFAITAGQARLDALDVLRSEFVDAKFLGHLTGLNTRALLGIASDLLGQLTDQRFGFADSFDIVSRSSGVVHTPNRLCGGEKFLASLALALALAELHSRSGPRLGSLFLDEGFAALDTAALQSALDVLRTQAGGDRLVMVISHLHAVAEAVDDVLWVERGAAGSTARWLTPAERDELVQADLASGLQTLA